MWTHPISGTEMSESHAHAEEEKVGVLLLNLGGPETLNDVQPFLYNLFADPVFCCYKQFHICNAMMLLSVVLIVMIYCGRISFVFQGCFGSYNDSYQNSFQRSGHPKVKKGMLPLEVVHLCER